MSTSFPSNKKHKHQRSSSRKLFDSEPQIDHETLISVHQSASFDVQYYVDKSNEAITDSTIVFDRLQDLTQPSATNLLSATSLYLDRLTKDTNKIHSDLFQNTPSPNYSEYFPHWKNQDNFACLSNLKRHFHTGLNDQTNRIKFFRQRRKNKLLEINAQYQIQNGLMPELEQWPESRVQTLKMSTRKSLRLMERNKL